GRRQPARLAPVPADDPPRLRRPRHPDLLRRRGAARHAAVTGAPAKVAAIQFRPQKGDWLAAAAALTALVEEAVAAGAGLVVCPELALTGYLFPGPDAARAVAEPARGRTFAHFSALARRLGCHLVI